MPQHRVEKCILVHHSGNIAPRLPVLAIWGERDVTIPLAAMGRLAQWNRDAWQTVIPGAGHALGYTRPKEVLAAVEEHLREV